MKNVIFVIGSNEDEITLIKNTLSDKNITNPLVFARDGEEAMAQIEEFGDILPALILLDLSVTKVSGLEILQTIKSNQLIRAAPVVILTSAENENDIDNSYIIGANSCIKKPLSKEKFEEAIGDLGMYWLALNRPNPNYK